MRARTSSRQMRAFRVQRAIGDPKVVPSGIDDPEVRQAPRAILEILLKRPPSRCDQVTFTSDIVNLEHQLNAPRRQPRRAGGRDGPSWRSHPHGAPLHRDVRARVTALILRHAEAQYPGVKVDGRIKVGRKDLKSQRHLHPLIVADPHISAAADRACLSGRRAADIVRRRARATTFPITTRLSPARALRRAATSA